MTYSIRRWSNGEFSILDHSGRFSIGGIWVNRDGVPCFCESECSEWTPSDLREIADLLDKAGPLMAEPITPDQSETR